MTLFVEDTFTGSGDLSTHTGETGATWTFADYDSFTDTRNKLVLSGGGITRTDLSVAGPTTFVLASGVPPSADYYVEADFNYAGPEDTTGNTALTLFLRAGAWPQFTRVTLYPGWSTSDAWLWTKDYEASLSHEGSIAGPYVGDHTLRAEIEGTTLRTYVDGVLLNTFTIAETDAGLVGLGLADGTSPSELTITAFRAGTLGAPPPAGFDFWTATTGVTQT